MIKLLLAKRKKYRNLKCFDFHFYFEQQKQLNSEENLDFFLLNQQYYTQLGRHNDV